VHLKFFPLFLHDDLGMSEKAKLFYILYKIRIETTVVDDSDSDSDRRTLNSIKQLEKFSLDKSIDISLR
jgi:hypothetical protein